MQTTYLTKRGCVAMCIHSSPSSAHVPTLVTEVHPTGSSIPLNVSCALLCAHPNQTQKLMETAIVQRGQLHADQHGGRSGVRREGSTVRKPILMTLSHTLCMGQSGSKSISRGHTASVGGGHAIQPPTPGDTHHTAYMAYVTLRGWRVYTQCL